MSIMTYNTVMIIFLLLLFFKHAFVHASDIKIRSVERRDVDSGNNTSENNRSTDFTRSKENSMNRQTTILSDSHQFSYQTSISPNAALILSEPCYPFGTCELTQTMKKQYCNCDKQCLQFKDCCHDIKYDEHLNSVYTPYYHCYKDSNDEYTGVFTVTECPDTEVNTTVTLLCQSNDLMNVGPCVVNNNIIFKNKYCAFCHNITLYDTFDLEIHLNEVDPSMLQENISRSERMDSFFENSKGYQLVAPNGITIRSCMLKLDENNDTLCQKFTNPVYQFMSGELKLYRNRFCVPVSSRDLVQCIDTLYGNFGQHTIYSMTILFSFEERKRKTKECSNLNYQINASNPCDLEIITNYVMQPLSFYLVSSVTLTKQQTLVATATFQWTMTKLVDIVKVTKTSVFLPKGENSKVAEVKLHASITKPSFIHEIKTMERNLNNLMLNMFLTYDNNTIELIKEQNLPLIMQNESFGRINDDVIEGIVKNLSRNSVNLSISEHFGCNKISVLAEPIELFNIQVIDIVCHEYHGNLDSNESGELSSIKAILTYLCFSVSVVALVFSLIMSRKFDRSSSIAGSNTENISISLICSYVLFVIGGFLSKTTILCYTVSVILHYLWLSVFSFMLISVLYIAKNLTSMKSSNRTIKQKGTFTRRVLMVTALLIPVVFVVPAVILDQLNVANLSIGYGNSGCFPYRYPAFLIFLSGPVVLLTAIKFAVLFAVIIQLCLLQMESKHIIKSSNFRHAKLVLRFVLLSGTLMVMGFLSGILYSDWLNNIFLLMCGLQGLFFSIANLTTKYMCGNIKSTFSITTKTSDT